MEGVRFVAEFTTNPMGNLNLLMRMVEKAASAGCNLIKMQKKGSWYFLYLGKTGDALRQPFR